MARLARLPRESDSLKILSLSSSERRTHPRTRWRSGSRRRRMAWGMRRARRTSLGLSSKEVRSRRFSSISLPSRSRSDSLRLLASLQNLLPSVLNPLPSLPPHPRLPLPAIKLNLLRLRPPLPLSPPPDPALLFDSSPNQYKPVQASFQLLFQQNTKKNQPKSSQQRNNFEQNKSRRNTRILQLGLARRTTGRRMGTSSSSCAHFHFL